MTLLEDSFLTMAISLREFTFLKFKRILWLICIAVKFIWREVLLLHLLIYGFNWSYFFHCITSFLLLIIHAPLCLLCHLTLTRLFHGSSLLLYLSKEVHKNLLAFFMELIEPESSVISNSFLEIASFPTRIFTCGVYSPHLTCLLLCFNLSFWPTLYCLSFLSVRILVVWFHFLLTFL